MKVNALIEKAPDGSYSVFVKDNIPGFGISGYGDTVDEAKKDLELSVSEMREAAAEMGRDFPDTLEIDYTYDVPSFFDGFKCLNISAFARMAGINESKLRAYKSGAASASEKTISRIMETARKIGRELSAASL